jgi:hypothetical protein
MNEVNSYWADVLSSRLYVLNRIMLASMELGSRDTYDIIPISHDGSRNIGNLLQA